MNKCRYCGSVIHASEDCGPLASVLAIKANECNECKSVNRQAEEAEFNSIMEHGGCYGRNV